MIVYSVNGEDDWHESMLDVVYELEEAGLLFKGSTYYTGTAQTPLASSFLNLDVLLEYMGDAAYNDYGDAAEGFTDLSVNQYNQLESVIKNWLDENLPVCFYSVVDKQVQYITEEWLAENS